MNNPLTLQVESRLGALYVSLLGLFFVGLIFIALKNFNSDSIILNSQTAQVKTISTTERDLINGWITENQIEIPQGKGYRYVIQQYPSKPWFK
ncbi:MAG: hypothetical protein A3G51_02945 [Candidatus Yanofskybacteria bacterium RIFCSPLOWO2_12_FULL_43_11b]|uniref:Uncharacterized protein n=1 Tax=Candidatus Yanofskybacteria bacterium RIFCSPLOWO2_12_FULL_43_11b TaxID=1802710 RepID=A0A1F8H9B4_9BACT|nr:MAG: hypothetical protein A2742_00625 [Candidatus Yanofskybacteria bacterium RIFCSPHIGHO2_01_FULL_43_32]OGN17615.1 MAG: hypothetical protein A3E34_01530 [Candidatus Yanofskybacteria bacterium RIFCSPHIGHO2_12_FULL_43_11]OGN24190.1 MAG: hypothetical protein A2923_02565 [Candidatus Yanofskybacteria bacterium RIFCSPLOWO2_01_FULL_43_46]OGN34151.1 MAG: hypothetical protein A3G51_02945 [Candidatus Yanofskybacteria bacterium RIFCSPLOWO2_12_FULL_43_11b]